MTCTANTHIQRTSLRYAADVKRSLKRLSLMPRFLQREYFRHTASDPTGSESRINGLSASSNIPNQRRFSQMDAFDDEHGFLTLRIGHYELFFWETRGPYTILSLTVIMRIKPNENQMF